MSKLSRATSYFKREKIGAKYPRLMQELNDPHALVPAYVRFQDQKDCVLREDLRLIKEQHFRKVYERHISQPKKSLERVAFHGDSMNASTYYDMRYFLNEDQKKEVYKTKANELHRTELQETINTSISKDY